MKVLKYSRQREAIKEFLLSRTDHPTADVVYENVRQEFPNISLGTVYRNLNLLVEIESVAKISLKDGVDRFDAKTNPHYHFVCNDCGCVSDLPIKLSIDLNDEIAQTIGASVTSHEINFYGLCKDCKAKIAISKN